MQMGFKQYSRNNTYVSIPEKLSEIHLHVWSFSNPCGKILIIVGILWSPDLRVQHIFIFSSSIFFKFHTEALFLKRLYFSASRTVDNIFGYVETETGNDVIHYNSNILYTNITDGINVIHKMLRNRPTFRHSKSRFWLRCQNFSFEILFNKK